MKNLKLNKKIIINLQVEGLHQWKDCPIKEVDFLKDRHRHIFHICIKKTVSHNDRDIEIIYLKREVLNYLGTQPIEFGNKSCETIAEELLKEFDADYVSVLEDNENGAEVSL
ncbi:MAG: hypothetical protein KA278_00335 [Flavobacterium sp.]|nr:hypothetical protein [Flavobacterium sp.]